MLFLTQKQQLELKALQNSYDVKKDKLHIINNIFIKTFLKGFYKEI